ncbi:MAG: hypothetical protein HYU66_06915 [Armatimonadetes bacterium]|nr:hypothetical protein [Armatimonadota bacterium]
MPVIEIEGVKMDEDKLMNLKPACPCCRKRETRLILPTAGWNTTGSFVVHCYVTGRMNKIKNIVQFLDEQHLLDEVKVAE